MTELKPSTEGDARNPSAPSEPRPANLHPATPKKPAQPAAGQTASTKPSTDGPKSAAPIKPAQPSATRTSAPTKPAQPNGAQSTAAIRPSPAKGRPASPAKPAQPSDAEAAASAKPGPANRHAAAAFIKPSPAVTRPAAPIKPAQPGGTQPAPTKPGLAKTPPAAPTKPAQPSAARTPAPTKPNPTAAAPPSAPAKPTQTNGARPPAPRPAVTQPPPLTKPTQPGVTQTAASTKPGSATTAQPAAPAKPTQTNRAQPAAPTKSSPAVTQTKPTQPGAAQTAASTKPDLAETQAAEALIKAAMAQSAVPTKPTQTNSAQPAAPTNPGPAVTQPLPLTKPTPPGAAQTAAPTQPGPAGSQAPAPRESSAKAADPGRPSPAETLPAATPAKRRRVLPIVLASVAATLVAVLAVAAIFVKQVERSMTESLEREDLMPIDSSTAPHPTKEQAAADALNFVVMGYDSRDPSVARSGSLMILHLNAERDQAYFISFPRDTWVSIPGHGNNKINAAYGFGGPKLTVSTLESLTDTRMDHAAMVDLRGFAKLTDEVGGVTVYNKTAFSSHNFHYPKGNIALSGERAIYFVGERRQLPRGDFDRAANERNVVRAIIAKTLSTKIITDPKRLLAVVSGAAEHLTVDKGLTDSKIRSTVLSLRLTNKDVHLMKAPVSGKAIRRSQRVDVVDKDKLAELRTALRQDTLHEYLAKYPQG
jgi:polyisoprenyl-teichoic acid--peptidoglycan teichoic acid transferase